jgi:acyl transferase domain-containing protein
MSVVEFAANIANLAASASGAPVGSFLKVGMSQSALAAAKTEIKNTIKEIAKGLAEDTVMNIANNIADAAAAGKPIDWSTIDPVGIGAIVQAYNNPICN